MNKVPLALNSGPLCDMVSSSVRLLSQSSLMIYASAAGHKVWQTGIIVSSGQPTVVTRATTPPGYSRFRLPPSVRNISGEIRGDLERGGG